jgi:hypothetical protein
MEDGSYQINYQFPFRMLCSDREGIQCPIQPWNSSPTLRLYLQPWVIDGSCCLVLVFLFSCSSVKFKMRSAFAAGFGQPDQVVPCLPPGL